MQIKENHVTGKVLESQKKTFPYLLKPSLPFSNRYLKVGRKNEYTPSLQDPA